MRSKQITIIALTAAFALFGVFYFVSNQVASGSDAPPQISLDFGPSAFTGQLTGECPIPGFRVDPSKFDAGRQAPSTNLSRGVNIYYSEKDITASEIVASISPAPNNRLMFLHYNPIDNPQNKFSIYPPVQDAEIIDITKPEEYIIPKNHGIILLSCKDTKVYNLKTSSQPPNTLPELQSIKDNWVLLAAPSKLVIGDLQITSAWPQQNPGYNNASFTKVLKGEELEQINLQDQHFIWIKVSGPKKITSQAQQPAQPAQPVQPAQPAQSEEAFTPPPQPRQGEVINFRDHLAPQQREQPQQPEQPSKQPAQPAPVKAEQEPTPSPQPRQGEVINFRDHLAPQQPEQPQQPSKQPAQPAPVAMPTPQLNPLPQLTPSPQTNPVCSLISLELATNERSFSNSFLDRAKVYRLIVQVQEQATLKNSIFTVDSNSARIILGLDGLNNFQNPRVPFEKNYYLEAEANNQVLPTMPPNNTLSVNNHIYYFLTFSDIQPTQEPVASLQADVTVDGVNNSCKLHTKGLR